MGVKLCSRVAMERDARYWIAKLGLEPHPEGGYFRQTYKSELILPKESLPTEFAGARAASTAIYFLLEGENFSAFHRLRWDEIWHFHLGALRESIRRYCWGRIRRTGRFCRRWFGRDAGLLRMWRIGSRLRWWGARLRRVLSLRILRWGRGMSWFGSIRSIAG
jgi:hypothetical protein